MGPQGGAEMRTKQTSDIILFNINDFFLSPSSPEHVHLNTVKHETAEANVAIMDTRVEVGNWCSSASQELPVGWVEVTLSGHKGI